MLHEPKAEQHKTNAARKDNSEGNRVIFRSEVLERYIQDESKTVLPRYVSPRSFIYLWVLAGLFLVTGLIIIAWPVMGPLLGN